MNDTPTASALTELVLIGGGEHARVLLDAARSRSDVWRPTGYVDPQQQPDIEELGLTWLGTDMDAVPKLSGRACIIAVGGNSGTGERQRICRDAAMSGVEWTSVIHASATVSDRAFIGAGVAILTGAVVNAGARIDDHAIINSGAIVEHDVQVGPFVHLAPGAVVGGGAAIGRGTFVGLGARIRNHIRVGADALIGMGAVVVRDVPDGAVMVGVPARPVARGERSVPPSAGSDVDGV